MQVLSKLFCACAAALLVHTAQAQSSVQGADAMIQASTAVAQMIDQGKPAEVWNGATQMAKNTVTRDVFVTKVNEARKPLGAVSSRTWTAVRRQVEPTGTQIPAGHSMSVEYDTVFSTGKSVRELVTFRLDEDTVWRFMGYWLQPATVSPKP